MGAYEEQDFTYAEGQKKIFYLAAGPKDGPLIVFVHGQLAWLHIQEHMDNNNSSRLACHCQDLETPDRHVLGSRIQSSRPRYAW